MRTEEHTDHLLAYSAGKLRGDAAAKLELHMRVCEDCASIGRAQANVWNLLDSWEARPVSAEFNRRLYAKIEAAESSSWWQRLAGSVNEFLQPVFARPALPLAAASLVIAAGFVLDHPEKTFSPMRQSSALSAEINKVEVDQVEATLDNIEVLGQFEPKQDDSSKDNSAKPM
jgi:hypothetical protein